MVSESRLEKIRRRNDPRDLSMLRKSERTRQEILNNALKFLWSKAFRDLTVAELMVQTGSSRSCFYQYFADLHDLMENLLHDLEQDFKELTEPWLFADSDPASHLSAALKEFVKVCYQQGPIVRAVIEAAPMDERLEKVWRDFVKMFDDAVTARIELDQAAGLVADFEARPVAVALNRMDIGIVVHHFGRRPRSKPEPVYRSIERIWISTIYGRDALSRLKELS